MEYQIIYSGSANNSKDPQIYKALQDKDHGGGHSVIGAYAQLKKDTNIIFFGKFNEAILSALLPNIKSLENTAGHLFFPNQRITDAEAISIAERSGKKVIFTQSDTHTKWDKTTEGFTFATFKDNKLVPWRCARPNTSEVVVAYKNIHEIPHHKNSLPKTEHSPIEWGHFVDPSLAGATPCESPEPTTEPKTQAAQEPQTKKARISM